ncbi:receptor expression-enhancing protein 5-like [Sipha flava]|uniref:Receptor expression-enhancing protein n=1 Tax=Sipha flava TaxID=143950 RepID=A0A8B8G2Q9_9HEMI|nr:receptor expression-enhancing protein 5-like [Sipha flava]
MDLKHVHVVRVVHDALHDDSSPVTALFEWAENRSGVQRMKLFVGLMIVIAVYLTRPDRGTVMLGNVIGFVYPAYMTIAMLLQPPESRAPRPASVAGYQQQQKLQQQQHQQRHQRTARWFVYWMVFAAALIVHQMIGGLLALVPFYGLIRVAFFVWCFAPVPTNGADFVYALVVRRHLADHFAAAGGMDDADGAEADSRPTVGGIHVLAGQN